MQESLDPFQMQQHHQQLGGYEANCNGNGNGGMGASSYKNGYEESIHVDIKKEDESFNNLSQASSCDYSMSQFRSDEPPFEVKNEQSYAEEDSTLNDDQDDDDENDNDNDNEDMDDDQEDIPLAMRKRKQEPVDQGEDDDDDVPLLARKKVKKEPKEKSKKRVKEEVDDDYSSAKPKKKKIKKVAIEIVDFACLPALNLTHHTCC